MFLVKTFLLAGALATAELASPPIAAAPQWTPDRPPLASNLASRPSLLEPMKTPPSGPDGSGLQQVEHALRARGHGQ